MIIHCYTVCYWISWYCEVMFSLSAVHGGRFHLCVSCLLNRMVHWSEGPYSLGAVCKWRTSFHRERKHWLLLIGCLIDCLCWMMISGTRVCRQEVLHFETVGRVFLFILWLIHDFAGPFVCPSIYLFISPSFSYLSWSSGMGWCPGF